MDGGFGGGRGGSKAIQVSGLQQIRDSLRMLSIALDKGTVSIAIPDFEADKLEWLKRDGRDMLQVSPVLLASLLAKAAPIALKVVLGQAKPRDIFMGLGFEFKLQVANRLMQGGADVKGGMRALSPQWIKKKGHANVGYYTGATFRAIFNAKITVEGV